MDGGRENRFLAGGAEISRRGGGMTAAPARTKAKAPTPLFTQSKSLALLQSARCHGILILEKHNVFEKEAVKCLF